MYLKTMHLLDYERPTIRLAYAAPFSWANTSERRSRNQRERLAASGQRSALSYQLVELGASRLDPEFLVKITTIYPIKTQRGAK
jgi:hypothetical protein